MNVTSADFAIDFYALVDYRFVRLFRLLADLKIPIALVVNDQNQLVPVIGDLSGAFENLRVIESQLLEEDPETLAAIFPTLLDMVIGQIGGALNIDPIDLPDMQGFSLVLDDGSITAVDGNTLLAIYADLAYTAPQQKNRGAQVTTIARVVDQWTPDRDVFAPRTLADYEHGPSVTLKLGAVGPIGAGDELEWQYRVDDGFWSPFTDNDLVTIRRPIFHLQGYHHLDVRARVKGVSGTLDPEPVRVDFVVDAIEPELMATRLGNLVTWAARDNVSPADRLEYSVKVGSAPFTGWARDLEAVTLTAAEPVTIKVRDEAGNETVLGLYGRVKTPPDPNACGCRQTGTGDALVLGVLLLFALVILRRRRRNGPGRGPSLPFLILALTAGLARCNCNEDSPGPCKIPDGGIDLICTNPELECDDGYELAGTEPMTYDPVTCEPIPVLCECRAAGDPLDPGDWGRFLSIDAREGDVLISCYSDRFGDLVVADLTHDASFTLVPEPVDGAPSRPVTHNPESYRGGVSAPGDKVGTFTSLVLDASGIAHVSYVDEDNGTLKVARGTPGDWVMHEVEEYEEDEARVWFTAIHLLPGDIPAVAYQVTGLIPADNPKARVGELRYARASSNTPEGPDDWTVQVVGQTQIPCGGLCEGDEVCIADTWLCELETDDCGGCADGEVCVQGACYVELPKPDYLDHPEGLGNFVHTGLLSNGNPVLAFHDRTQGLAMVAIYSGTAWDASHVVEGDEFTDIGLYISLAVDGSDVLHLTYTDAVRDELIYNQVDTSGASLVREVIDDGIRPDGRHVTGLDSKVFFDSQGNLLVLYQDGTTSDLYLAQRGGADDWTIEPLMVGDPGYGFFVDAAVDTDGTVWVAQYVYDRDAEQFTRLEAFILP